MKNKSHTFTLAVQPRTWETFDAHGANYVTDMVMAKLVANVWGEACTVWGCPPTGAPFRLRWV